MTTEPDFDYAIAFVGGPLDGLFMGEGEMAQSMRERGVVTIDVEESDTFEGGQVTYLVREDGTAEWMAAYKGEAN